MMRYQCRLARAPSCVHPIRLKESSELKNLPDERKNIQARRRVARELNHGRINPIKTYSFFEAKQRGIQGMIQRRASEGKRVDYSQAAVKRAAEKFAAEQKIRSLNGYFGRFNRQKRIPLNTETIEKVRKRKKVEA
ncbi:MAG: hypothetical protein PHT84_06625 [Candidatus Pacebacteria bacterium]|nr:hypothetical protein [Candidatus Paceibacterota bacterium]